MNVFLSYASEQRPLADDLCYRLQAAGHEVFFDREDLPAGLGFDDQIRAAIEGSDLFIFLVTPQSVAAGRYTRTELKIASRKWVHASWHVLPVLAEPTPLADVPAYLRALNLLQPEGNLVAEVVLEVQQRVSLQAATSAPVQTLPPAASASSADPSIIYRSLQLRFERAADGSYQLAMADGDPVPLLIDPTALGQQLWQGAMPVSGTARRGGAPALLPAVTQARAVGQALHDALFQSTLGAQLVAELRQVDPQHGAGLRVIVDATAAPELASLPWEFLYSSADDDHIFSDRMKPLVRRLSLDRPPPVLAVAPPLRLLVVVAAPADRAELQVGAELAQLDLALAALTTDGRLQTSRLDHASLERLDEAMLRVRPHVLHFIGHGDMAGDDGVLILESDNPAGSAQPISGRQLGVLLRNHLGSLRLVFLNSCLTAAALPHQAFAGVAQNLVRRGLPAVVAMQFPIPDQDAIQLARHFYRYLAAGQAVDSALTSARGFMVASGADVSWGAPALYLSAEDGRLFDIAAPVEAAPAAQAAAPDPLPAPAQPPPMAAAPQSLPTPAAVTLDNSTTPAPRKRVGLWLGLLAALVLLIGAVAWWLGLIGGNAVTASGAENQARTEPSIAGAAHPTPAPIAAPAVPVALVEQAQASLAAGQSAVALAQLNDLLGSNPDALGAQSLGARHAPLATALAAAAGRALQIGSLAEAQALAAVVERMGPFDSAMAAKLDAASRRRSSGSALPAPGVSGAAAELLLTVQAGDTFWGLARRFLGDGARWPELWQHHQSLAAAGVLPAVPDPDALRAGQLIALPGGTRAGELRYHVQPGDSLSKIAQRVYGEAQRWPQIQRLNALSDPDHIRAGQLLLIQR